MRKPTSGSVGAFFTAVAVAIVIVAYGHQANGDDAQILLWIGYGLLGLSIVVMLWEHLVRRPTWPRLRSPITWRPSRDSGQLEAQLDVLAYSGEQLDAELRLTRLDRDDSRRRAEEASLRTDALLSENERVNAALSQAIAGRMSADAQMDQMSTQLRQAIAQKTEDDTQLRVLNTRLMNANNQLLALRSQVDALEAMQAPPPIAPPPDKEQLILLRARGLPMFDAMYNLLEHARSELTNDDEGFGNALATLLKSPVLEEAQANRERAVESGNGNTAVPFHEALRQFLLDYDTIVVWFARLYYRRQNLLDRRTQLDEWASLQSKFEERLEELIEVDQALKDAVLLQLRAMRDLRARLLSRADWWATQAVPEKEGASG